MLIFFYKYVNLKVLLTVIKRGGEYVEINIKLDNLEIFDKAIGRPAMMGFLLLMGTYLVTGQLIPGWF